MTGLALALCRMEVSIRLLNPRGLPNRGNARTANQATEPHIAPEDLARACSLAICYTGPTVLDEFAQLEATPAATWLRNRRCRHSRQLVRLCPDHGLPFPNPCKARVADQLPTDEAIPGL